MNKSSAIYKSIHLAILKYWKKVDRKAKFMVWMKDDNTLYLWQLGKKYAYRYKHHEGTMRYHGKKFRCNARNRNRNYSTIIFSKEVEV